jgi:RNA ligase
MSTSHVAWGSIELLHNVVRTLTHLHELGHGFPVVAYRAKVKLHGSNCAVQLPAAPDVELVAQSRTALLTPQSDYKGFATWAHAHAAYFATLPRGLVIFGEWCGPGVEKGMAISQASSKMFAIFGVQVEQRIVYDPEELRALVPAEGAPAELHVLPWQGEAFSIDYGSRESLEEAAQQLSDRVSEIEREDPWVKRTFGISGLGEGLVLYPVKVDGGEPPSDAESLARLMFKAKGEKHRTAGARTAVQVDASAAASVDEFVTLMVTEARLEQGLGAVGGRDSKLTGKFLAWIAADVRKESVAELEASKLTWAQVEKAVQVRARAWFLGAGSNGGGSSGGGG